MKLNRREYQRAWRARNPDRSPAYGRKFQLKKYGLRPEDYSRMFEAQMGLCAICGRPERVKDRMGRARKWLTVDHKDTRVRGLLCHHCNVALGHAEDRPELLRRMAEYLEAQ